MGVPSLVRRTLGTQESRIQLIDGDTLTHTAFAEIASKVARMFTLFEEKFSGVQDLLSQTRKAKDFEVLKQGKRYMYCLITNSASSQNSTNLKKILEAIRNHCIAHGIYKGLNAKELNWEKVLKILEDVFPTQ
uniref:Uncharacterized protein n=1 Tax=Eptatretus burgeri TaxID=7764 RepID=A0A8C4RB91_EPTBU